MACVIEYRSCLKLVPKTLFGVMVHDAKKTMKSICSSPQNKRKALHHLKCFDRNKLPIYYSMLSGYTNVVMYLAQGSIPLPDLIGSCCCAFHQLYQDAVQVINGECFNVTNADTGVFVGNLIRSVVSSAVDVACGKHSSLEVCNQLQPDQMRSYLRIMEEGQRKRFPFSPVIPMVKVLNMLDSRISL